MKSNVSEKPIWNPYVAGFALGLVLLSSFVLSGKGLGASGAVNRACAAVAHCLAPTWAEENPSMHGFFTTSSGPLSGWIVFQLAGAFLGAAVAVWTRRSFRVETVAGPGVDRRSRWALAALGGAVAGFAAQVGRGCTSGQVLSGGAQLAAGSWIYMWAMFGTAFLLAYPLRRQWLGQPAAVRASEQTEERR